MTEYVFGVDIGGTTVKMGLFTSEGELMEKWEIPTRTQNGGELIFTDVADSIIAKMQENKISRERIAGVGVGVPGPVDSYGVVHEAVNLGWGDLDVNDRFEKLLGVPVVAGNDANVAALGEMWKGGGEGHKDVVAVTLGTGVGGGIIVDGKLVSGSTGSGGEIGHMHLEDNEEIPCNCENKGCLEQYASATGIVRLAKHRLETTDEPSVLREGEVSAKTVFDAVKAGDPLAIKVAEQFGEYLGKGLSLIASVVNPDIFVIGGGVSKAGEVLIDYIKPPYLKYAFKGCRNAQFALAKLGNDAGIYGAAKLALK